VHEKTLNKLKKIENELDTLVKDISEAEELLEQDQHFLNEEEKKEFKWTINNIESKLTSLGIELSIFKKLLNKLKKKLKKGEITLPPII